MIAPIFLELFDVQEIHDELLASFAGKSGVRDTSHRGVQIKMA